MGYADALNRFQGRGRTSDGFGGDVGADQTDTALRRLISPSSGLSNVGTGVFATGARTARTAVSQGAGPEVVAGPLDVWQENAGRPGQQLGKYGTNLMGLGTAYGPQGVRPGDPPPNMEEELMAMSQGEANPANKGFWEYVFSGLFGVAGDVPRTVGGFIGSVIDAPIEAAGNLGGLPGAALTVGLTQGFSAPWDAEIQEAYDASVEANPVNALLMWQHAAKAQWNRDQREGKHVDRGLSQHIGPAVALTDQLGFLMQWMTQPQTWVTRALRQNSGEVNAGLRMIREAAESGDTSAIKDEQWRAVAESAMQGHYGDINSTQARDQMIDAIVASGGALHEPEQEMDFGQLVGDILWSVGTDPLLLASLAVGGAGAGYKMGAMAASGKYWEVFNAVDRPAVVQAVGQSLKRLTGFDDVERAWAATGRDVTGALSGGRRTRTGTSLELQALREVADDPRFAAYKAQAHSAVDYIENWRSVWEPALQPVVAAVRNVNDPFRLLSLNRGRSARDLVEAQADTILSSHSSEAAIRGIGSLTSHANLMKTYSAVPGLQSAYSRGIGVATANLTRSMVRNGYMEDLMRRVRTSGLGAISERLKHDPNRIVEEIAPTMHPGQRNIATKVEQLAVRYKRLFLATEEGGDEAAMARARAEAAQRVAIMGNIPLDEATAITAKFGYHDLALNDFAYFGHVVDDWTKSLKLAQAAARRGKKAPKVDPEKLTILGPQQMTAQEAERVLAMIADNNLSGVRNAIRTYDTLFVNFSERIGETSLNDVATYLRDQIDGKALPTELEDLTGAPKAIRDWAAKNTDVGYRVGWKPASDNVWRVTRDSNGELLGINPWIDFVGVGADVRDYNRWQLFKDVAFHNVRGERIIADARERMARYTSSRWGVAEGDAMALFSRFLKEANEQGITPRGLQAESIYQIVKTLGLDDETINRIGVGNAVHALNYAFEGNVLHVGISQKFTGAAKTITGGQGNWLGQVAEKIYPMARFTLNPFFQAQELVEPFVMNLMRGIKPGFRASDMDADTLQLVQELLRDSRYAFDDSREMSGTFLWGADSAHNAYRRGSRLGDFVRAGTDRINVKQIKRVNYARTIRREMGQEFVDSMTTHAPDVLRSLEAQFPGWSWGERAIAYLADKSQIKVNAAMLKPSTLGAQAAVRLDDVLSVFTHHAEDLPQFANTAAMKEAVADGSLDRDTFVATLVNAGADVAYADNAWHTAAFRGTPDQFWDDGRAAFGATHGETLAYRSIFRSLALNAGMTEEQYLARWMADTPSTAAASSLAALSPSSRRSLLFHAEYMDDMLYGRPAPRLAGDTPLDDGIRAWTEKKARENRETLALFDDQGNLLGEAIGYPYVRGETGAVIDAAVPASAGKHLEHLWKDNHDVHNHPTYHPFSHADLLGAIGEDVASTTVTHPAGWYRVVRPAGGWVNTKMLTFLDSLGDGASGYSPQAGRTYVALEREINRRVNEQFAALSDIEFYQQADPSRLRDAAGDIDYEAPPGMWDELKFDIAAEQAIASVIEDMGYTLEKRVTQYLPLDPLEAHALVVRQTTNPPGQWATRFPDTFRSDPAEAVSMLGKGTDVSYEYTTANRPWELPAETMTPGDQRIVQDRVDNVWRMRVGTRLQAAVTAVVRGMGDWFDPESKQLFRATNSVANVLAPPSYARAMAAAAGYLNRQNAVITSRVLRSGDRLTDVVDTSVGQRWAVEVGIDALDDEAATAFAGDLSKAVPRLGSWGSSVVKTEDGYAVRFVDGYKETNEVVDRATFEASLTAKEQRAVQRVLDKHGLKGEANAEVVDYEYLAHDWEADPSGQTYLAAVAAVDPALARDLAGDIGAEFDNALAEAFDSVNPAGFRQHIEGLSAQGVPVPAFTLPVDGIPREWRVAPTGVVLSIPGGELGLAGGKPWTAWEQIVVRGQRWQIGDIYRDNPMRGLQIHRRIWGDKFRDDAVLHPMYPEHLYNTFAYGALTSGTELRISEGAFGMLRSVMGERGWANTIEQQRAIANLLENAAEVDDPAAWGQALQVFRGQAVPSVALHKADWLNPVDQYVADDLGQRINAALEAAEDPDALARSFQKVMDTGPRSIQKIPEDAAAVRRALDQHPTSLAVDPADQVAGLNTRRGGISMLVTGYKVATDRVRLIRPDSQLKSATTNTNMGRVLLWLRDEVFTDEALAGFLTKGREESRSQYGLRMAAILPGLAAKTAFMSIEAVGPGRATHAAMDTWMIRHIALMADSLGLLDDLLSRTKPAVGKGKSYADKVRESLAKTKAGQRAGFPTPDVNVVKLPTLPKGEFNDELAERMRTKLAANISDPDLLARYTERAVLERINAAGGRVYLWGGDYEVMEDFFYNVLRTKEMEFARKQGHAEYADALEGLSRAQYQWQVWDRIRSDLDRVPLDPHVSANASVAALPRASTAQLDAVSETRSLKSPYEQHNRTYLHEDGGVIRGATQVFSDMRAIMLATEHADRQTFMHEAAHVLEQRLDPSLRNVVFTAWKTATGSKRSSWSRATSEWWADQYLLFIRSNKVGNPKLAGSFDFLSKRMNMEQGLREARAESERLAATRDATIASSREALRTAKAPLGAAKAQTSRTSRLYDTAGRRLVSAQRRNGVEHWQQQLDNAEGRRTVLQDELVEQRVRVKSLKADVRAAEARAKEAAGTSGAGGRTGSLNRRRAALAEAEARLAELRSGIEDAGPAVVDARRNLNAAKRRTPLTTYEERHAAAKGAFNEATSKQKQVEDAIGEAESALESARNLPKKAKTTAAVPEKMNPEVRSLLEDIHAAPVANGLLHGDGLPLAGAPYDLSEEAGYQAAVGALSRAEENAHTLHYYRRGRSLVERSINHPYFGLYPASYMWGKVLPEILRFMLKSPFGIEAPLAGLMGINNVYRTVLQQQLYDEDFRKEMAQRADAFRLIALMTPSLPWEVPVNAPLWLRRTAEQSQRVATQRAEGVPEEEINDMTLSQLGGVGRDMFNYAFGPAATIKVLTDAITAAAGTGQEALNAANQSLQGLFAGGQPLPLAGEATPQTPVQAQPAGVVSPQSEPEIEGEVTRR